MNHIILLKKSHYIQIIKKYIYIINICQIKSYVLKEERSYFIRVNYTREEALIRGRHYLNICLEDKLIKNIKFKKSENPKITVIVPIYNSEKFIRPLTRSIQN